MSYRGRGGFSERRGRGGYRGGGGGGYNRPSILGDRPRRSPEWKGNSSRDNYERDGNWNDRSRDTRREEVRNTRKEIDVRDSRRSEFERERYDDRRDEHRDDRSRNGNHFESDFRQKRKYSGERSSYQDSRSERGTNHYEQPSAEYPHKRQHFETRGRGYRGRGDISSRRDELFRERRSFRDSQRGHSIDRSRNTSGHRSERGSDRRNISNFISNIRHKTSPRAATDKSAHVPTKEELELESQVIDEKFYETMTLDQRDYIASKALRILVTKSEGKCKLSELEYELMDIKIMFVSSELFMEFLQSFMDDDNVFEIIEAEPEEKQEEKGEKNKENKDTEKTAKGTVQVKKEPIEKDDQNKDETDEENNFTNIKDTENKDKAANTENEKDAENTENQEKAENTENLEDPENMDENNDPEEAEMDSNLENAIIVGRPKIVFCQKYVTNIVSCSKNCGALHICKFYILSKCNAPDERNCCFRHSLDSEHNQEALRLNLLHTFSIDHLKSALSHLKYRNPSTLPPICWFYNTKGCIKSQAGGCPFLHMCEKILKGEKCDKGKKCILNHDILANREVLTRFGMWSPEYNKDDLMKVISQNYVAHDTYAKKFPDFNRDHKEDYYSKSGIQKPRWQLFIPSEEMWMDLTETCHRELESKHRAVVRAKDEYEEAIEEMKRFKTSTLIGEKKDIPEISNKIFRRLDQETESKSKEKDTKVKKKEEHEKEKEQEVKDDDNEVKDDDNDDDDNEVKDDNEEDNDGKVKVKEETEN